MVATSRCPGHTLGFAKVALAVAGFAMVAGCGSEGSGQGGYEPIGGGYQLGPTSGSGAQGGAGVGGAMSTTTTSTNTTATTSSGMTPCPDPAEPNDDIGAAFDLGQIDDSDANGGDFLGVAATGGDVDWFSYRGVDATGSTVDPTRDINGTGVKVCKFIQCDSGQAADFSCPMGTTAASEGTLPGCCWGDALPHSVDLTCGSTSLDSDNATIFIKVESDGSQLGCVEYLLTYHY